MQHLVTTADDGSRVQHLVTTADGRRATVQSVRWPPMLVTPAAVVLVLMVVRAVSGPLQGVGLLGKAGPVLAAMTAAFVADDAAGDAAPATPVELRARLTARAVVALPVVVLGWLLVLAAHEVATAAPGRLDVVGTGLASASAGFAALAVATVAARLRPLPSPGAAGMGVVAAVGAASMVLPNTVLRALPPATVTWPAVILAALGVVAVATQERLDR